MSEPALDQRPRRRRTGSGTVRVAGAAAVLGGVAWFGKAAAILATGEQPPLLFEFAPMLFGFGLLGLRLRLTPSRSWLTRTGGWFAAVALILSGGDLALGAAEEGAFSPLTLATSLAVLAALILLGVPTRRRAALPGVARVLPLTLGVATFPLLAVGGALEVIDERLLEVPLLLLAAGWIWLGAALWRAAAVTNHTRGNAEGGGATRRRPRLEPGRSRF